MTAEPSVRVATWNVERATPGTRRGDRVAQVLSGAGDLLAVTECHLGGLPDGHVVDGGPDWGYPVINPDRRKVALWSPEPWTDVDQIGSSDLPPGRFVAATTSTPIGALRVAGICIPWSGAHVTSGRRDRSRWQEHERFLEALPAVLAAQSRPLVVAGDFNQRIPRVRQPVRLAELLDEALLGLHVATAGPTELDQLIDHIAVDPGLEAGASELLPSRDDTGRLSDHVGVRVKVSRALE